MKYNRTRLNAAAPTLAREVKRLADFLEGICILEGPQARAFTAQQRFYVQRARNLLSALRAHSGRGAA